MRWFPHEHRHTSPDRQEDRAGDQRQVRLSDPCRGALTRTSLVARGNRNGIRFTAGGGFFIIGPPPLALLLGPPPPRGAPPPPPPPDTPTTPPPRRRRPPTPPRIVA